MVYNLQSTPLITTVFPRQRDVMQRYWDDKNLNVLNDTDVKVIKSLQYNL